MNVNWKASGKRQEMGPPTKEKPYVIQLESEKPAMLRIISMTTSLPLQLALEVSDCQTGAVDVLSPLPIPAIMRPTIITGTLKAAICIIAPTVMILVPRRMVFLRPSMSPMTTARMAPAKQPVRRVHQYNLFHVDVAGD